MTARPSETMVIESGNASLFTTVYRKRDADTVILLHGGPGVPMDDSAIALLLHSKYQVVSFEQRGTGRSPAPGASYSLEEYVGDLSAIADTFSAQRFHLFGHSWGGLYAQVYAQHHPSRLESLFLCSPSSGTGALWKQTEREVMGFNRQHAGTWGWTLMGLRSLLGAMGSDRAYQLLFKRVLNHYNRGHVPDFEATDTMVEHVRATPINRTRPHILSSESLKRLEDAPFPIQILYGEHDIYGESKQAVRDRYPGARVAEVEGAGHIAWLHAPHRFRAIAREFYGLETTA